MAWERTAVEVEANFKRLKSLWVQIVDEKNYKKVQISGHKTLKKVQVMIE